MEIIKKRSLGIDFVKFFYIWMMVVYHCFYNSELISGFAQFNINSFLGFVSGGFPWLSGYLIGFRYFDLNRVCDYKKIAWRGIKLLIVYFISNMLAFSLLDLNGLLRNPDALLDLVKATFYGKPENVIYDILVPLGVLSIISSFIVLFFHKYKIKNNQLVILILILAYTIYVSGYLYLTCAISGVLFGFLHANYPDKFSVIFRRKELLLFTLYLLIIAYLFNDPRKSGFLYVLGVTGLFVFTYGVYIYLEKWLYNYEVLITSYASHSLFIYMLHVPILIILRDLIEEYFLSYNVWITFASISLLIIIILNISMKLIKWLFIKNLAGWYKIIFL